MPTVSIIVPVYKSENYISRCIDSIFAQTFTDFELILVNDGSPDNSGNICDEYAAKDSRIKVIHQENKGASAARNKGIAEATGKYLMFCDSDDVVSPMWVERLVTLADADVLAVGSYCHSAELLGAKKDSVLIPGHKYLYNDYYSFNQAGVSGFLWNAIYDRDIVVENNITLREKAKEGDYNEDLIFALQYVSKMKYIIYTGYADYLYDTRPDSMSHSFDKFYFDKYSEKYILWRDFIEDNCKKDADALKRDLSAKFLYHFLKSMQMCVDNKEGYEKFKRIVLSDVMRETVNLTDASKENPKIINMIKNKKVKALYCRYLLQNLKRRCKQ